MWQSQRDFQRVWEGWEAGFLAFHAFLTLSFPWPALERPRLHFAALLFHLSGMLSSRTSDEERVSEDQCRRG